MEEMEEKHTLDKLFDTNKNETTTFFSIPKEKKINSFKCNNCNIYKEKTEYSKKQLKKKDLMKCKKCIALENTPNYSDEIKLEKELEKRDYDITSSDHYDSDELQSC